MFERCRDECDYKDIRQFIFNTIDTKFINSAGIELKYKESEKYPMISFNKNNANAMQMMDHPMLKCQLGYRLKRMGCHYKPVNSNTLQVYCDKPASKKSVQQDKYDFIMNNPKCKKWM